MTVVIGKAEPYLRFEPLLLDFGGHAAFGSAGKGNFGTQNFCPLDFPLMGDPFPF